VSYWDEGPAAVLSLSCARFHAHYSRREKGVVLVLARSWSGSKPIDRIKRAMLAFYGKYHRRAWYMRYRKQKGSMLCVYVMCTECASPSSIPHSFAVPLSMASTAVCACSVGIAYFAFDGLFRARCNLHAAVPTYLQPLC